MPVRQVRHVLVPLLLVLLAGAAPPAAATAGPERGDPAPAGPRPAAPRPGDPAVTAAKKLATPGLPGANDWACRPGRRHPRPLVLVHGTFATGKAWGMAVPVFRASGRCVFVLDYGKTGADDMYGMGPIAESAKELAVFVDGVRAATGAARVDIVGHSQGGMMPRQYLKFEGGAKKVHTLVGISPSNRGTTLSVRETLAREQPLLAVTLNQMAKDVSCGACWDQLAGSDFLKRLNEGGLTLPGISYAVAATKYDSVVTPYKSQYLYDGPDERNVLLQNHCAYDFTLHSGTATDPIALRFALNALDPGRAVKPDCGILANGLRRG
ncbi:lipase family alpha/beta hydrolase [Streptomyces sp. NPDC059002]|uniref:lipase family alpha/beta hydrolase n=1 Tax=Streptomyces sp. NPDC059002 TaxID=3346690 RepID=UPI0036854B19